MEQWRGAVDHGSLGDHALGSGSGSKQFVVAERADLAARAARLDEMGVVHSSVKELDDTANSMLTFRDPDNIQLEFFWRAPSTPSG